MRWAIALASGLVGLTVGVTAREVLAQRRDEHDAPAEEPRGFAAEMQAREAMRRAEREAVFAEDVADEPAAPVGPELPDSGDIVTVRPDNGDVLPEPTAPTVWIPPPAGSPFSIPLPVEVRRPATKEGWRSSEVIFTVGGGAAGGASSKRPMPSPLSPDDFGL